MEARIYVVVMAGALALIVGCSDSGLNPVHGTVTFEGKPLPTGSVRFYPAAGGRPAVGQIQPDGTYRLATVEPGDGAKPGRYRVAIEAIDSTAIGPAPASLEEEMQFGGTGKTSVTYLLPQEFSSHKSSGLTASVEDQDNTIDFDLP